MRIRSLLAVALLLLSLQIFRFQIASAHTTITIGDYEVEVGWVDEPPVVGQQNAIVVNVSNTQDDAAVVDVSNLTVTVSYGGESKSLTLEPAGEDTTNEYVAPILPTVAGEYTVELGGQIDTTDVDSDVSPEEVVSADTLEFPTSASSAPAEGGSLGWSEWLSIIGAISGLAGLVLALLALRRPRA